MIERKPRILPFRWLEAIPCIKPSKVFPGFAKRTQQALFSSRRYACGSQEPGFEASARTTPGMQL